MYRLFYVLTGFFGATAVFVFQNAKSAIHEIEALGCVLIAVLALGFGWFMQGREESEQGKIGK